MRSGRNVFLASLSMVLLLGSALAFLYPLLMPDVEGTLTVSWANPKGIRFNDLSEDDTMEVAFDSRTGEVQVYLLTRERAKEFRSPAFYKEPLPEPVAEGGEGKFEVVIPDDGDWELLFWNDSFRRDHLVDYSIDTHFVRDRNISLISGTSLLLLTLLPAALIMIPRLKERRKRDIVSRK